MSDEPSSTITSALERGVQAGACLTILGPDDEKTISQADLNERAAHWAAALAEKGVQRGDRVCLWATTSFDFVCGCLAAWYAGAVAVPLPLPARWTSRTAREELAAALIGKVRPRAVLIGNDAPAVEVPVPKIAFETLETTNTYRAEVTSVDPAVIQFTSGSTRGPKGAVLSHGAITSHLAALERATKIDVGHVSVSWLPLYHDLGLFHYMVRAFVEGYDAVLFPTQMFVSDPERWLVELSRWRATLTSAPSFAYALASRALEATDQTFDLSHLARAGNGGEFVSAPTFLRFIELATPHGFSPGAVSCGYGLAEATCAATLHPLNQPLEVDRVDRDQLVGGYAAPSNSDGPRTATFTSMGPPLDNVKIEVRGHEGPLEDRNVGEIAISTPAMMSGYFDDPESSSEALREGWLLTGDLGYLVEGRLFVTGRIKDLIVSRGRNYSAEDLEPVVHRVKGVRKGGIAAISSTSDGGEGVALLVEVATDGDRDQIRTAVTKALTSATGLIPTQVLLLEPRSLPKTSSGKLRRAEARRLFETGAL